MHWYNYHPRPEKGALLAAHEPSPSVPSGSTAGTHHCDFFLFLVLLNMNEYLKIPVFELS